jgi:alkylhydroperoxidase family enzyme
VLAHCPPLVLASAGLSAALERSGQLPAELRDLVCLRIAQIVGCPF